MTEALITVVIDVPRGSFIKRDDDGTVDFVYPLPCPFNYGHVPGTQAEDGDAAYAIGLGKRLPLGTITTVLPQGRIDFLDAGRSDPKWICAAKPISELQRMQVTGFFRLYAAAKSLINRIRGKHGVTRYVGWL